MSTTPNQEPTKRKRTRANNAELRQRVEDILYARLNGAELFDLVAFAKEKGWNVSKRQLQRYAEASDRLIEAALETDRPKLLRRHLAQRRNLYARAVNDGDWRTALAVAQDEAELEGLYPRKGFELSGANGKPLLEQTSDEQRVSTLAIILARFGIRLDGAATPAAAAGAGGVSTNRDGSANGSRQILDRPGPDLGGRGL